MRLKKTEKYCALFSITFLTNNKTHRATIQGSKIRLQISGTYFKTTVLENQKWHDRIELEMFSKV